MIQFYKKAIYLGDYIAFILPISQLNNKQSFYEFDLIYSEDLGVLPYTNKKLRCCYNIYKRNDNGMLNQKPKVKIEFVDICRHDNTKYNTFDFDIRMCYWGNGSAGKILYDENEKYAAEYKIKIKEPKYRQSIIDYLTNFDWGKYKSGISMLGISQVDIYNVIKQYLESQQ